MVLLELRIKKPTGAFLTTSFVLAPDGLVYSFHRWLRFCMSRSEHIASNGSPGKRLAQASGRFPCVAHRSVPEACVSAMPQLLPCERTLIDKMVRSDDMQPIEAWRALEKTRLGKRFPLSLFTDFLLSLLPS